MELHVAELGEGVGVIGGLGERGAEMVGGTIIVALLDFDGGEVGEDDGIVGVAREDFLIVGAGQVIFLGGEMFLGGGGEFGGAAGQLLDGGGVRGGDRGDEQGEFLGRIRHGGNTEGVHLGLGGSEIRRELREVRGAVILGVFTADNFAVGFAELGEQFIAFAGEVVDAGGGITGNRDGGQAGLRGLKIADALFEGFLVRHGGLGGGLGGGELVFQLFDGAIGLVESFDLFGERGGLIGLGGQILVEGVNLEPGGGELGLQFGEGIAGFGGGLELFLQAFGLGGAGFDLGAKGVNLGVGAGEFGLHLGEGAIGGGELLADYGVFLAEGGEGLVAGEIFREGGGVFGGDFFGVFLLGGELVVGGFELFGDFFELLHLGVIGAGFLRLFNGGLEQFILLEQIGDLGAGGGELAGVHGGGLHGEGFLELGGEGGVIGLGIL